MFTLQNGGAGAHHIVLLWPLPHPLAACLPVRRWKIALVVFSNLLQINHFYGQFLKKEVSVEWPNATDRLAACLIEAPGTRRILDWGIYDSLHLLLGPGGRYITHIPELSFNQHDMKLIPEETSTDSAGRRVFIISRAAGDEGK